MFNPSPSPPPRKSSRWRRRAITAAAFIALAIWGYVAARKAIGDYLGGQDLLYRISLATAETLRAPSGYLPIRWRGFSAFSDGLLAQNKSGNSLTELRALNLNAHLNASKLWKRKVFVERAEVQRLQAAFGQDAAKLLVDELPGAPRLYAPNEGGAPVPMDVGELAVDKADLFWGKARESNGAFREITASFWPDRKNLVVFGYGGRLQQHGFPETKVSAFQLYYEQPTIRIDSGTLTLGERGQIVVNGTLQFTKPGAMDLGLHCQHCPSGPFLSEETRSKFEGSFNSDLRVKQELGSDKAATAEGEISAEDGLLQNVSALEKVADLTGEERFRKLKFNQLSAKFRWTAPELSVADFVAESKGLLRVEGDFRIKNETIYGSFQLGVSAEALKSIPGAREEVFEKERDGYYWTRVKIEGPIKNPRENLKERLVAGAKRYYEKKLIAPLQFILRPGREIIEKLEGLF